MTEEPQLLRRTIAELLKVEPEEVRATTPLNGRRLQGSIGRATLDAALRRRLGLTCPAAYTAATYGELEAAIVGAALPDRAAGRNEEPTAEEPRFNGRDVTSGQNHATPPGTDVEGAATVYCGVDMEDIDRLPEAADAWAHEFYRQRFSPAEIAYCTTQQRPAQHFAARWCAKEALLKCDAAFTRDEWNTIELVSNGSSAPYFQALDGEGKARRLSHSVSIAHTNSSAIAVVISAIPGSSLPGVKRLEELSPEQVPGALPGVGGADARRSLLFVIALIAFAVAAWALERTFRFHAG